MWKTGHSLIEQKMTELGAPLAGELSGHMYIGDGWYGFDDAIYSAARILSIVARAGRGSRSLYLSRSFSAAGARNVTTHRYGDRVCKTVIGERDRPVGCLAAIDRHAQNAA